MSTEAELKNCLQNAESELLECEAVCERLRQQLAALCEAWQKYGQHAKNCALGIPTGVDIHTGEQLLSGCTCGFDNLPEWLLDLAKSLEQKGAET